MTTQCPYCQSIVTVESQTRDFNRGVSSEQFTYLHCSNCDLVFLDSVPTDLGRYYLSDYYDIPQNIEQLALLSQKQKHKLQTIQEFTPKGKLLEIGSSYGDFAYLAKEADYDVSAIEMDANCCQFLRTQVGIQVFQSDNPREVLKDLEQFDIIAMWQVIEHMPAPFELLDVLAEHIAPNGILVLAAPNPAALQFRVFGSRWAHIDAPRHLQLIPIDVLRDYLRRRGLTTVYVTSSDGESLKANTFGWKKSIMNLLGVRVNNTAVVDESSTVLNPKISSAKFLITRTVLRLLVGVIELCIRPLERTGLRGTSYTMVFQKIV